MDGSPFLEEVAFALDLMWSVDAPLVVTSDLGVVVVMNDRIHAPSRVQKRHTTHVDAVVGSLTSSTSATEVW